MIWCVSRVFCFWSDRRSFRGSAEPPQRYRILPEQRAHRARQGLLQTRRRTGGGGEEQGGRLAGRVPVFHHAGVTAEVRRFLRRDRGRGKSEEDGMGGVEERLAICCYYVYVIPFSIVLPVWEQNTWKLSARYENLWS